MGYSIGGSILLPAINVFGNIEKVETKKLNIALCGLGRYANILAKGLQETKNCKLTGIITGTPKKEGIWKSKYDIPDKNIYNYENFDQIKNNQDIDLVYVVLPNGMHKEYTIRAAQAGKHVIVEKPMALNAKDCQEMIDACNKANVQLAVGYRLHYEPHHIELQRLGQDQVFGPVRLIEASLGYNILNIPTDDWHLNKALSGGGVLMNLGVYCIQSNRYILGEEPISVTAQFSTKTRPELFREVEENISWQLNFPSGAVGTSNCTSNCHTDHLFASAENGFFELDPGLGYGPFEGKTSEKRFDFPIINQQAAQMDGISKCILESKPLPDHIAGIEGLKDMKVIDAIYKSAETGREIKIN